MRARTTLPFVLLATLSCAACSRTQTISAPGEVAYEVSLAPHGERLAMAWHGGNGPHSALFVRLLGSAGKPEGDAVQISDGLRDAYEPDLQPLKDGFVLAWYEKETGNGHLTARLAMLDGAGGVRWRHTLSEPTREGRNPLVRVSGERILAAWLESGIGAPTAVWTAEYDAGGHPTIASRRVGEASNDTWNINGAVAGDGALYVVYDARVHSRSKELQLLRITGTAVEVHTLTDDDGFSSVYPDLALSGNRAGLTWLDYRDGNAEVYVATGTLASWCAGAALDAHRVTHSRGESMGAYAAWNGSQLGIAWSEPSAGGNDIRFQRFDAQGRSTADAQTLSAGDTHSYVPAIRPWHAGFAVAWNDYRPGATAEGHDGDAGRSDSVAMLRMP